MERPVRQHLHGREHQVLLDPRGACKRRAAAGWMGIMSGSGPLPSFVAVLGVISGRWFVTGTRRTGRERIQARPVRRTLPGATASRRRRRTGQGPAGRRVPAGLAAVVERASACQRRGYLADLAVPGGVDERDGIDGRHRRPEPVGRLRVSDGSTWRRRRRCCCCPAEARFLRRRW